MAMMAAISHSPLSVSLLSQPPKFPYKSNSAAASAPFHPIPNLRGVARLRFGDGFRFKCNCTTSPGGSGSGDNESKSVLDAFFLGKAFAEAINERIESTIGEILSTIGRLQAEQQKQVQEFQDEVLERAKRAKEKAARESKDSQGLPIESTTTNTTVFTSSSTSTVTPN